MQNVNNSGVRKVTFWQQCDEAKVQLKAEMPERMCSRDTGNENFAPGWFLSVSQPKVQYLIPGDQCEFPRQVLFSATIKQRAT
jgi:hypothetical protein